MSGVVHASAARFRVLPWPNSAGGMDSHASAASRKIRLLGPSGSVLLSMARMRTSPS